MKFQFKIYNPVVIDCSSCYNTVFPDPKSREILLQILERVCESDVVAAIGSFSIKLNDIDLQSPDVIGHEFKESKREGYGLCKGESARDNKIAGLFVEEKDNALNRISTKSKVYYIEPGLNGVRKCINYIRKLYLNNREDLPNHLKELNLQHFSFSAGVIWGKDVRYKILILIYLIFYVIECILMKGYVF